jgi:hypothetical protein
MTDDLGDDCLTEPPVDYRVLLTKYITHVGETEGVTFIHGHIRKDGRGRYSGVVFTPAEVAGLLECDAAS